MKRIKDYISEKLYHQEIDEKLIVNNTISKYTYFPQTKNELIKCIKEKIKEEGIGTKNNPLNLNNIDVSKIKSMYRLFCPSEYKYTFIHDLCFNGNFDISEWDVSNVKDMGFMFFGSEFNGDISKWDVSNVTNMTGMFYESKFNGNISKWNVKKVKTMGKMFYNNPLDENPPKWYKED